MHPQEINVSTRDRKSFEPDCYTGCFIDVNSGSWTRAERWDYWLVCKAVDLTPPMVTRFVGKVLGAWPPGGVAYSVYNKVLRGRRNGLFLVRGNSESTIYLR